MVSLSETFPQTRMLVVAALAPLLFKVGKALVGMRMLDPEGYLHKVLSESGFGRYFNRAMLLAAVILVDYKKGTTYGTGMFFAGQYGAE